MIEVETMDFVLRVSVAFLGLAFLSFSIIPSGYSSETVKVRFSPLAGNWYPADPDALKKMLDKYLEGAQVPTINGKIFALISPHAGYTYSGQAAAYGFKTLLGKNFNRVMIIGPSHHTGFRGICVSSYDYYETPLGKVPVEKKVGKELSHHNLFLFKPQTEAQEHALEMEIPFLQMVLKNFKIVPLIVGGLKESDYPVAADLLHPFITDKTLVVVSSDFTHYGRRFGYIPFTKNIKNNLKKLDLGAVNYILRKDFKGYTKYLQETGVTICGRTPIGVLLLLLPPDAEGQLLNYYTSGDLLNDYTSTVSYVSLVFKRPIDQ